MKLFGGGRKIVRSNNQGSILEQTEQCLNQLNSFIDKNKLYPGCFIRHSVFINVENTTSYLSVKDEIIQLVQQNFPSPQLINVIAQAPNKADVAIESGYIDHLKWNNIYKKTNYGACQWLKSKDATFVVGQVQCHDSPSIKENSESAFKTIEKLLKHKKFSIGNIVRQWNYVEHILEYDEKVQRYQAFNDVRSVFYEPHFNEKTGYPAATGIGMRTGGVLIEFIATDDPQSISHPIDNPRQRAAHQYTQKVLPGEATFVNEKKTTPKFERARSVESKSNHTVFISGTAAITGEKTVSRNDVVEQTIVTIENIKQLITLDNLNDSNVAATKQPALDKARIYVKHRKDFDAVEKLCKEHYPNADCLIIKADICRDNLLVEIEGEAVIE